MVWLLVLEEYIRKLINIPGHENIIDDTLSWEYCIYSPETEIIIEDKKNYYELSIIPPQVEQNISNQNGQHYWKISGYIWWTTAD